MLTEQEFQKAAETYLDMTYRIALNWFRRPADAEDAVQETMLRLWRTNTAFTDEENELFTQLETDIQNITNTIESIKKGRELTEEPDEEEIDQVYCKLKH